MEIIHTTVYHIDELSDEAQEKAREWYRLGSADDSFWYECVIDHAKDLLGKIGFFVKDIRFSGFSSQGDGASFTGTYSYAKSSVKTIARELPQDDVLRRITQDLRDLQRRYLYQLSAEITPCHSCHYVHERSTSIYVEHPQREVSQEDYETLKELIVDINQWVYHWLESEYDYQNSDEIVDENIRANEYTFTKTGKRFG